MAEENPFRERLPKSQSTEALFAEYCRGRQRVKQVLAYIVLLMFMALVARFVLIGIEGAVPRVGRLVVAAVLAWLAFRGVAWARWLLVALLALGCVADLIVAVRLISRGDWDLLMPIITFFAAYATVIYYVAFDRLSNEYFRRRRELRREVA